MGPISSSSKSTSVPFKNRSELVTLKTYAFATKLSGGSAQKVYGGVPGRQQESFIMIKCNIHIQKIRYIINTTDIKYLQDLKPR